MTSRALATLVLSGAAVAGVAVSSVNAGGSSQFELADRIGNETPVSPVNPPSNPPPTTTTSPPTTTPSSPTTTVAPTTTVSPPTTNPSIMGAEGHVDLFVVAKGEFDQYTQPTDAATWAALRSRYDGMMVFAPYFDQRVDLFDDHYVYVDLYGLDAQSSAGPAEGHLDWVLETQQGDPVYIPFDCSGASGCTQFAADVGNPAYQAAFLAQIADLVGRGYGGVMIDDVNMLRRFSNQSGQPVPPMNPRTGELMTLSEWRQSVAELLEEVRAAHPNIEIMHNAVWFADTPGLTSPYVDKQIAASDLIGLERGATDPGLNGGNGDYSYGKFIALIDRVHRLG